MRNDYQDDDFDDFMSNVMNGASKKNRHTEKIKNIWSGKSGKNSRKIKSTTKEVPSYISNNYHKVKSAYIETDQENKKIIKIIAISLIAVMAFVIIMNVSGGINNSNSPIDKEISKNLSYEPYYPSRLPFGFKPHEDTVKQPEKDVLLYSLIDERGTLIHISMQPIPEGLDKDKASSAFTEKREINTPIGTAVVGESPSGKTVTNLLTKKSWIIVTYNKAAISDEDLEELLKSFEQV